MPLSRTCVPLRTPLYIPEQLGKSGFEQRGQNPKPQALNPISQRHPAQSGANAQGSRPKWPGCAVLFSEATLYSAYGLRYLSEWKPGLVLRLGLRMWDYRASSFMCSWHSLVWAWMVKLLHAGAGSRDLGRNIRNSQVELSLLAEPNPTSTRPKISGRSTIMTPNTGNLGALLHTKANVPDRHGRERQN